MSIGQAFGNTKQVIVLVENRDGTQHAFQIEMGTVRWEWTGMAHSDELGTGSTGRLIVEGRFHRKSRDSIAYEPFTPAIDQPRGEIGQ